MCSTWYVNIYIYSSSCTVHGMLIFKFTAVHVQYMVCSYLHLQQFMYSTWYVNIYIYSSSCTVHRMWMFTFTAVHVQYMVCECLHLQQFMYSTWYVNVYIYSSSQGAGRIAGVIIVNIYIYSSSCTVHGMLIFTFTAVHVQYMVC